MSIFETAKALKREGWSEEQIRSELRGTVLSLGDFPTCSDVEEAIAFANKSVEPTANSDEDESYYHWLDSDPRLDGETI